MNKLMLGGIGVALALALPITAFSEVPAPVPAKTAGIATPVDGVINTAARKAVKPYRTFIHVQRYNMEQSGDSTPISNVRIEMEFPNKSKIQLPEGGQFWPIGNGQVQEINRTFELPWQYIQNDGFKFTIQMIRKGSEFLPCQFDIVELSEFNRSYVCHTDMGWQASQKIAPEKQDKEGIQIRIFTDRNSKPNEIPNEAIALK